MENIVTVVGFRRDDDFSAFLKVIAPMIDCIMDAEEYVRDQFVGNLKELSLIENTEVQEAVGVLQRNGDEIIKSGSRSVGGKVLRIIEPWTFQNISWPRFEIDTKLFQLYKLESVSEIYPNLTFVHEFCDDRDLKYDTVEYVYRKGYRIGASDYPVTGMPMMDFNLYPTPELVARYTPMTLAQRADYLLEYSVRLIENHLLWILESNTYTKSPLRRPENLAKENETRQRLRRMAEHMKEQAKGISFANVLVELPDNWRELKAAA